MCFKYVVSLLVTAIMFLCSSAPSAHPGFENKTIEEKQAFWEANYERYLKMAQNGELLHLYLEDIDYYWTHGRREIPPVLWPYIFVRDLAAVNELKRKGLQIPAEVIRLQNEEAKKQRFDVASKDSKTSMESLVRDGCAILSFEGTMVSAKSENLVKNKAPSQVLPKAHMKEASKEVSKALPENKPPSSSMTVATNSSSKVSSTVKKPANIQYHRVEMCDKLRVASDPYFVSLIAGLPVCNKPVLSAHSLEKEEFSKKKPDKINEQDLEKLLEDINFDDVDEEIPGYLGNEVTKSQEQNVDNLDNLLDEMNFDDVEEDIPSYLGNNEMDDAAILQLPVCTDQLGSVPKKQKSDLLLDS